MNDAKAFCMKDDKAFGMKDDKSFDHFMMGSSLLAHLSSQSPSPAALNGSIFFKSIASEAGVNGAYHAESMNDAKAFGTDDAKAFVMNDAKAKAFGMKDVKAFAMKYAKSFDHSWPVAKPCSSCNHFQSKHEKTATTFCQRVVWRSFLSRCEVLTELCPLAIKA